MDFINRIAKCHRRTGYTIVLIICSVMLCESSFAQTGDAILTWGEPENRGANIYFSQRTDAKWSKPKRLSFSEKPEILPTLASNASGEVWVVWTELHSIGGKLLFRHYKNGRWEVVEPIKTNSTSDMAPSTIVDSNGDIWLVWSGTHQTDDDIFYSLWKDGHWTAPLRINTDDNWPDILPQLSLTNNGLPQVTWSGYDGNKYSTFTSHWTGNNWSPEQISNSSDKSAAIGMASIVSELSDFVTDINQATIHFHQQGKANTLRLKTK